MGLKAKLFRVAGSEERTRKVTQRPDRDARQTLRVKENVNRRTPEIFPHGTKAMPVPASSRKPTTKVKLFGTIEGFALWRS